MALTKAVLVVAKGVTEKGPGLRPMMHYSLHVITLCNKEERRNIPKYYIFHATCGQHVDLCSTVVQIFLSFPKRTDSHIKAPVCSNYIHIDMLQMQWADV